MSLSKVKKYYTKDDDTLKLQYDSSQRDLSLGVDTNEFSKRKLDDVVEEAQQEIEEPELIHKRIKDQMFPSLQKSTSTLRLGKIKALHEHTKTLKPAKSLSSLQVSEVLYHRYIEKQYEDDLDNQAKEAGGGEYVYHQLKPEFDDEDYYMKKRKFLSKDTLQILQDKYKYVSNFKITDDQLQISNEYLLKVRNMYDELNRNDYKLDKPPYIPYSARGLDFDKQKVERFRSLKQTKADFNVNQNEKSSPHRVRQDYVSMMLSAKRLQPKSRALRNFKLINSLQQMIMPDLADTENKHIQSEKKKYQLRFKSRDLVKKEFGDRNLEVTRFGNNTNINTLGDLWIIESQINLENHKPVSKIETQH